MQQTFFISIICILFSLESFANSKREILLRDIGVIGLASHDMFTWDKNEERNLENGRLDLSTIFDYDQGKRWEKGGNPKNAENAPVWSVTKRLVKYYKERLKKSNSLKARKETVRLFHLQISQSYKRLFGMRFPLFGKDEKVTNTEQAVMRAFHDILPGRAKIIRRFSPIADFKLTNFIFAKFYLNDKELDQVIDYYDGEYAKEYQEIKIPFTRKIINLQEVDADFIAKFSPYQQENMLAELKRVGEGEIELKDVYFIHHIKRLFQKGICSKNNEWITSLRVCF